MADFLPGLELSRRFYTEAVRPLLGSRPHAAARLGPGSDVLGFDTPRSTDHDWGPRVHLFTDDPGNLHDMLRERLPTSFLGWPTHYERASDGVRVMTAIDKGPVDHFVTVTGFAGWAHDLLGFDPRATPGTLDWLATPWQRFAEFTGGGVFHDPTGELTAARRRIRWYPADLWRHVLACQWQRIAEEEAFVGRAAEDNDELGARTVTARLVRETGRLLMLLSRRWPPYQKWVMRPLARDPASVLLMVALSSDDPPVREDALCTALEMAAERQNDRGLAEPQQARRRTFHDRGYEVIGAERFAGALRDAITDPALRSAPPVGCIDQISDNTAVLTRPALARTILASALRP